MPERWPAKDIPGMNTWCRQVRVCKKRIEERRRQRFANFELIQQQHGCDGVYVPRWINDRRNYEARAREASPGNSRTGSVPQHSERVMSHVTAAQSTNTSK